MKLLSSIREYVLNKLDGILFSRINLDEVNREIEEWHESIRNVQPIRTPFMDAIIRQQDEFAKRYAVTEKEYYNPSLSILGLSTNYRLAQIDRDIEALRSRIIKAKKQKKRTSELQKQYEALTTQRLQAEMGVTNG